MNPSSLPASFDVNTATQTVLKNQQQIDSLDGVLKRKQKLLEEHPNQLQAIQNERDSLLQSLTPDERARLPLLEKHFQIRQEIESGKRKDIQHLPINEADKKLELIWKKEKEMAKMTKNRPKLEAKVNSLKTSLTKLKNDKEMLIGQITQYHFEHKTQPPKSLLFAGNQIFVLLENLSAHSIETLHLAMSKFLDDLIDQVVPGAAQPELDQKKEALDAKLSELKAQMDSFLQQQGNIGKKIAKISQTPLSKLDSSALNEAIVALKNLESLADASPTLVVAVLRQIPLENVRNFIELLFSKQALGVVSLGFILKIVKCTIHSECQDTALAILKGRVTAVNLFRQDGVVDKLPGEFQRYCLGNLLAPCIGKIHELCLERPFELDPQVVKGDIKVDQAKCSTDLRKTLELLKGAILANKSKFPPELTEMYRHLFAEVKKYCPGAERTQISALFFLRFVCPEILNPAKTQNFPADLKNSLKYVSKALQSAANNEPPTDAKMQFLNEGDPSFLTLLQGPIQEIVDLLLQP